MRRNYSKETYMDPITTSILSSFLYDMLKNSISITGHNIKTKLQDWAIDEVRSEQIAAKINQLDLNNEMNEIAINKKLESSSKLITLLSEIKPNMTTIIQNHSGAGDNIAGNKIINN